MFISFKLDKFHLEKLKDLQKYGFLVSPAYNVVDYPEGKRLVFNGPETVFVSCIFGIRSLFGDSYGSLFPIAEYCPDDKRFRWYEDLDLYLMERGTWKEFLTEWRGMRCADTVCEIPSRFVSQRNMFEMTVQWVSGPRDVNEPWVDEVTDYLVENAEFHSLVSDMLRNFKACEKKKHSEKVSKKAA